MQFHGQFMDGVTANPAEVEFEILPVEGRDVLVVQRMDTGAVLARWRVESLISVPAREGQLRIGSSEAAAGARLVVNGGANSRLVREALPALVSTTAGERRSQRRTIIVSTAILAVVLIGYFVGIPHFARQIVAIMPAQWDEQIGDTVLNELERSEMFNTALCDADPDSIANQALARFANEAFEPYDVPFNVRINVARDGLENAFALPGGSVFYFSGLLEDTETPDEMAGVLAHELGHVYHRHSMESVVSSAGTGLLVGFVLGDMTGLSAAGAMASAVIDSSNSRQAEREADDFAVEVAERLGYDPLALPRLLERIAGDSDGARAFALMSSHPLTSERRARLESLAQPVEEDVSAFTTEEWQAIRNMCGRPASTAVSGQSDARASGRRAGQK